MQTRRLVAAALTCVAATCANAAAFTDGSFESLVLGDGQQRQATLVPLDGWTATGTVFVKNTLDGEQRGATDGNNLVFMDNGSSMTQVFDTVAGQSYHVRFDYSKNRGTPVVLIDGQVAESFADPVVPSMATAPGFDFVASGASTALTFMAPAQHANGSIGRLFVDNVAVSPVPEAPGAAMFAVGALLLGGLGRRRRA